MGTVGTAFPADAQSSRTYRPSGVTVLSIGEGQVVNAPRKIADVWVSNPDVADVHVTNARQLNLFGKKSGEATLIATAADGSVVYATNVRVSQNLSSVNEVLRAAMPESNITVTPIGQVAVMNGTVASPEDAAQAQALVAAYLNPGKKDGDVLDIVPINRLKTATPLQVNLRVRIAEINRTLIKEVGVNLLTRDRSGGLLGGIGRGDPGSIRTVPGVYDPISGTITGEIDPITGALPGTDSVRFKTIADGTSIGMFGKILGLDVLGTLDLLENDGSVKTLAEPNLTALSGETASFLAGGEFPIPVSQSLGSITIEYKQYGVGLAFTPIVLADGRISMRVRPEVSELSNEGAVRLNNFLVPALTTRRAETTVELGSGQSFMIGGLLRNRVTNTVEKAPFLGDLPILGSLFRSTAYRRDETELVIIVTPYLVRPASKQLALPTDGYRVPTDTDRILEGKTYDGVSGPRGVQPTAIPAQPLPSPAMSSAPAIGGAAAVAPGFKL
ncbi:type II and III secretion system protein family protein [Sphingomonas lutea]|uniref:Type II and III secretion system protein family protein n=2 Tax=Sphingomonas lutea TaxID=1045317 RepID=A0A7G9SL36_9SPHN|nr:type II and III secretion system protein family protein [Sphingomonas lutea]